jgi:hypothetical protein
MDGAANGVGKTKQQQKKKRMQAVLVRSGKPEKIKRKKDTG